MRSVAHLFLVVIALIALSPSQTASNLKRRTDVPSLDAEKLGPHELGGRGCLGCHAPHRADASEIGTERTDSGTRNWSGPSEPFVDNLRDERWAVDVTPILELGAITTAGGHTVDFSSAFTTQDRIMTGVVYCLSCHDGSVAKGAMMTNQSFEQAAGLLPAGYGAFGIPTLLNDDGVAGNYRNDHPIGQSATVANLGSASVIRYVDLDSTTEPAGLVLKLAQPDPSYLTFRMNYGLPSVIRNRNAGGFAVDREMTWPGQAYVVCTTCHTPHSMAMAIASESNPIAGRTSGIFPSYFFVAAPFNPAANVNYGYKATSASQFCRQCHFRGEGGANESEGISLPTAF